MVKIRIPGLGRPLLAFSAEAQFIHIASLLEASEGELERQHEELLDDAKQYENDDFARWESEHAEELYESLTLLFRYGMLVALVTAVEWQAGKLRQNCEISIPKKPKHTNEAVHILESLRSAAKVGGKQEIRTIEHLIHARNLVTHARGRPGDYKHDVLTSIKKLRGFGIGSRFDYVGQAMTIQRDALVPYLRCLREFMPRFIDELKKRNVVSLE